MIVRSTYPAVTIPAVPVASFILDRAKTLGAKPALVDGPSGKVTTYAELAIQVDRCAAGLARRGLRKGETLAILLPNCPQYAVALLAVWRLGAVATTVNPLYTAAELAGQLRDADACYLLTIPQMLEKSRQAVAEAPVREIFVLGEAPGATPFASLLAGDEAPPDVTIDPGDIAVLPYSSGTTGLPKGVMLTHRNLTDNAFRAIIHLEYGPDDIYLHAAPMFHLADGSATFAITSVGGAHAHVRAFNPEAVCQTIARDHVTATVLVPTMIGMLINHPTIADYDLSSLRRMPYGGSAIAESTLRRAMEMLCCEFCQAYGMTEAAPILTILRAEDHRLDKPGDARRLLSAGQACIGIDLKVVDEEDREVPPGTVGEIVARGDNIMLGYWERPEETAAALRGGWYHTGDLATMDEDGYVSIVDRKKDMIVSGGENIYSVEVENALASHPSVLECAVIGVPDDRWGEAVLGVVVPRAGQPTRPEALMAHCQARIAGYKVPKAIVFTESLPKSGAGKILKRELRAAYWRDETRQVH